MLFFHCLYASPSLPVRDSHAPREAHAFLPLPRVLLHFCTRLFHLVPPPHDDPLRAHQSRFSLHFHLHLGVVRYRLVGTARDDLSAVAEILPLASFEWVTISLVVGCLVHAKQ